MPTKTKQVGGRTHIESPAVDKTVVVIGDYVGTAITVLSELEEADASVDEVLVEEKDSVSNSPKITIYGSFAPDGQKVSIPDSLHKQLTEWGFEHGGEKYGDFEHGDEVSAHVYNK